MKYNFVPIWKCYIFCAICVYSFHRSICKWYLKGSIGISDFFLATENKIDVICNSHINIKISNASTLKKSKKNYISFYHNIKYKNDLINTSATACFVSFKDKKLLPKNTIALVTKDPHKAFICVLNLLLPKISSNGIISKKALIHKNSMIGKNVEIQDNVIIKENVHIGDNSIICSNTTVNKNVRILDQ